MSGLDRFAEGGGGSGSDSTDGLMRLLGLEHSHWLIWSVALIPLGVGIAHLIKAWRAHFERYFQCDEGHHAPGSTRLAYRPGCTWLFLSDHCRAAVHGWQPLRTD